MDDKNNLVELPNPHSNIEWSMHPQKTRKGAMLGPKRCEIGGKLAIDPERCARKVISDA